MAPTSLRRAALTLTATAALLVAGCGNGGGDPADTVTDIFAAGAEGDYATVCELLTPEEAERTIEEEGTETCEEAQEASLEGVPTDLLEDVEVGEATEDGDTATVPITFDGNEDEITLKKIDDEWKVDE